jgi:hypothetical protein
MYMYIYELIYMNIHIHIVKVFEYSYSTLARDLQQPQPTSNQVCMYIMYIKYENAYVDLDDIQIYI